MPETNLHPATQATCAAIIMPGAFAPARHFYRAVLSARLHPLVADFLRMDNDAVVAAYARRHPGASADALGNLLAYLPAYFAWAGADLMHVSDSHGDKRMVLIENNSCPSGQKSLPLANPSQPHGGYAALLEKSFLPRAASRALPDGALAVICDKNPMENSGYAAALATLTKEPVYLAYCGEDAADAPTRFTDGILQVRDAGGHWQPVRAALRYVTQAPWRHIPLATRTLIYNPVVACLAGGRNKLTACVAYEQFNRDMAASGLAIAFPETAHGLALADIPRRVAERGGFAVLKDPYSNAGQGVWTIVKSDELSVFMRAPHRYYRFIAQSLIGHHAWRECLAGDYHHVGTRPDHQGAVFAFDLRLMIVATPCGYRPVSLYARRAKVPLVAHPAPGADSWDLLGTNLSRRQPDGTWTIDEDRLIPADGKGFASLGLGLDDLIDAFVQAVMSAVAIDRMALYLMPSGQNFDVARLRALDDDGALLGELGYG